MNIFLKIVSLLSIKQRKIGIILLICTFIGVIFEMIGITIILPILSVLSPDSQLLSHPFITANLGFLLRLTHNELVIYMMVFLVFIIFIKSIYLIFISWFQSNFSANFSEFLTKNLFEKYIYQDYEFHLNKNSAYLLANVQHECTEMMHIIQALLTFILELFLLLTVISILFYFEPIGAIAIGSILLVSAIFFQLLTKNKIRSWGGLKQQFHSLKNKYILQGLGGIKEIKIYGREETLLNQFNIINRNNSKVVAKYSTITNLPRFYFEFLAIFSLAALILLLTIKGKPFIEILPIVGIFLAAAFRIMPSVNRLISSYQLIKHSESIIVNIYDQIQLSVPILKNYRSLPKFKESIKVQNLSFQYGGAKNKALENINLEIIKGTMVGFIGKSGSGKSTLIDLLIGLLKPTNGYVQYDMQNIDSINNLTNINIGYIPQNIYLTDETLKKNIAFGIPEDSIDESKIIKALQKAELLNFVESLPDYLETNVGERGVKLSGGQRQRIGIARALYNSPELLILDESTSALDFRTEEDILKSILKMKGEITIIIIAHRVSTLKNCDNIYEIIDGKIIKT